MLLMEHSHRILFSLWLHLDFPLPNRIDFGDFDTPPPEGATKHSPVLYFYLLYSSFLWVSFYSPLIKHRDSGRCILNSHQQGINNNNINSNNNNNNNNKYQTISESKNFTLHYVEMLSYEKEDINL